LWKGRVGEAGPRYEGPSAPGDEEEWNRLVEVCEDFVTRVPDSVHREDRAAFRRLTRVGAGGLSAAGADCPYGVAGRGELFAAKAEDVALPKKGAHFDITQVPGVPALLAAALTPSEVTEEEMRATKCHADPNLRRGKAEMRKLAMRLFEAGIVAPVLKEGRNGLRMYTVLTKYGEDGQEFNVWCSI